MCDGVCVCVCAVSAGGLVTAVAPVVVESGGLWVGWPGLHLLDPEVAIPESDPEDLSPCAGLKSKQVSPPIIGLCRSTIRLANRLCRSTILLANRLCRSTILLANRLCRSTILLANRLRRSTIRLANRTVPGHNTTS